MIALDIFLRLALVEKKIALQWDNEVPDHQDTEITPSPDVGSRETVNTGDASSKKEDVSTPSPTVVAAPSSRRSKYPPIFTLLTSRRLVTALWGCIVQGSLMTAFDSVVPLFVQRVFHWDSIGAGLIFLALIAPSFASPFIGWISDKYGPRWLTFIGFIIAIPFWVLLRLITQDTLDQKVLFCVLLALIGFALTLVMPPLMAEITYAVEAKEKADPGRFGTTGAYAQAYGLFVTAFAAGTLIGPIWAGYVEDTAGWGTMTWSLGLFSLAGAIPCLIYTGGLITQMNAKSGDERAIGRAAIAAERSAGAENAV